MKKNIYGGINGSLITLSMAVLSAVAINASTGTVHAEEVTTDLNNESVEGIVVTNTETETSQQDNDTDETVLADEDALVDEAEVEATTDEAEVTTDEAEVTTDEVNDATTTTNYAMRLASSSATVPTAKDYAVKRGDNLYRIALNNGVSLSDLTKWNNISVNTVIHPGQKLVVSNPTTSQTQVRPQQTQANQVQQSVPAKQYTIVRGDSLYAIARRNNVSVRDLTKWNNISVNTVIYPGQKLVVSKPTSQQPQGQVNQSKPTQTEQTKPTESQAAKQYTIVRGDSLYAIARRNNVSVRDLTKWNNISVNSIIYPGQKLVVSKPTSQQPQAQVNQPKPTQNNEARPKPQATQTEQTKPTESQVAKQYTIVRGDSLYAIARRNNVSVRDLTKWNNISVNSIIHPGQKLVVSKPTQNNEAKPKPQPTPETVEVKEESTSTNIPGVRVERVAVPKEYTVKRGDFFSKIAKENGVTVADLLRWNKLSANTIIHPGDSLIIADPSKESGYEEKLVANRTTLADKRREKLVNWFVDRQGKVNYSMDNRYGPNSYDCSSAVYTALVHAGFKPAGTWAGTTNTLYSEERTGFLRPINRKDVQAGDIFVSGHKNNSLGGAGHTGIAFNNQAIIHVNYSDDGVGVDEIDSYFANPDYKLPTYWYRINR